MNKEDEIIPFVQVVWYSIFATAPSTIMFILSKYFLTKLLIVLSIAYLYLIIILLVTISILFMLTNKNK